jgi:hypothetical protein
MVLRCIGIRRLSPSKLPNQKPDTNLIEFSKSHLPEHGAQVALGSHLHVQVGLEAQVGVEAEVELGLGPERVSSLLCVTFQYIFYYLTFFVFLFFFSFISCKWRAVPSPSH